MRSRVPRLPALGAEEVGRGEGGGGRGVEVGAAVHDEGGVADGGVLEDGDGLGAVGPAAAGEGGVAQGEADVEGDRGVQAERLVEDVAEVGHALEVLVGGGAVGAHGVEDLGAQAADGGRVAAELVHGPAEGGGGGVAAGEEDGHHLVAEDLGVAGEAGEGVEEGVAGVVLAGVAELELGGAEAEGALDVAVDEAVHGGQAGPVAGLGDEAADLGGAGEHALDALDLVEGVGEFILGGAVLAG